MVLGSLIPGEFLSTVWWVWASSGLLCFSLFVLLWVYYWKTAKHQRISRKRAAIWATLITLLGLFFAAGVLWWLLEMIRAMTMP